MKTEIKYGILVVGWINIALLFADGFLPVPIGIAWAHFITGLCCAAAYDYSEHQVK